MRRRIRPVLLILPLILAGSAAVAVWYACAEEPPTDASDQAMAVSPPTEDWTLSEIATRKKNGIGGWEKRVDKVFGKYLVAPLEKVLFYDFQTEQWLNRHVLSMVECPKCKAKFKFETAEPWSGTNLPKVVACPRCAAEGDKSEIPIIKGTKVPLVVFWLLLGAIFFTLRMGFINFRAFWHAIRLTKGDYDNPEETGEVSHFQALASALSATIGLGNIAGVAIAVSVGGPGAIFWMIVAGLLGMSSKFAECSLSQMYREVAPDGTVSGGPMHYLRDGLKEIRILGIGLAPLGAVLAVLFAVVCIGGSFGGGCAFQVSQSLGAIREQIAGVDSNTWILREHRIEWFYGLIMAFLVGLVIIGGIRRIAATAEKIVPLMCVVYVLTTLCILAVNYNHMGEAFEVIFAEAFKWNSAYGGFLGVLVMGIRRAAFSNEAGIGSAAIAHAAAKTEEPIREGIVASLGPFIDTVVICTMTGLAIVITGVYKNPDYTLLVANNEGAALTARAFGQVVSWFPWILSVAVVLFAYSTMISWSYYGERCWSFLTGHRWSLAYRVVFLVFVVLGSVVTAKKVLDFSDLMILSMAFPNILGVALLSGKIRRALNDYWRRYKAGEMEPQRTP